MAHRHYVRVAITKYHQHGQEYILRPRQSVQYSTVSPSTVIILLSCARREIQQRSGTDGSNEVPMSSQPQRLTQISGQIMRHHHFQDLPYSTIGATCHNINTAG